MLSQHFHLLNNLMLSYFVNSWYRYMPTLVSISQKLGIGNTCNSYFWQVPAIWKSKLSILPIYHTGSYKYNETILYAHVAQNHWTFIRGKIVNQHFMWSSIIMFIAKKFSKTNMWLKFENISNGCIIYYYLFWIIADTTLVWIVL